MSKDLSTILLLIEHEMKLPDVTPHGTLMNIDLLQTLMDIAAHPDICMYILVEYSDKRISAPMLA